MCTKPWAHARPSTTIRVSAHSFGYIKPKGKNFHQWLSQLGHLPGDWTALRLQSFPGELFYNDHGGTGRELPRSKVSSAHGPQARPIRAHPFSLFIQIRSRAKVEKIRASLFNNNDLIGLSSLDGEDELMEMSTEEILMV